MQLGISIIRLDLLFETISGIIALIVTIYASNAYKITGQKKLSDLSTGFMVLSVGMFGRVIGTWYFFVRLGASEDMTPELRTLIAIVTIAYGASRIMAYVVFAVAIRPLKRVEVQDAGALMALAVLVDPTLEMIAIFVLVIVVIQALINYTTNRNRFALYVLVGFILLLLSHLFLAQSVINLGMYLMSQVAQLLGFLSFLVLLYKTG
ncbi:MAG: hypothetical protein ACTSV3_08665 [Candidatus Thorarchaeota archaeon]|nr:MAG: hypothetical protein DRP09_11875 [Candidatus Thorarchaeota archaeon]RLI59877.1 MAG: hypothetical protein DRO87_01635 [Candidatus Thorarchaeota archaeon]